MASAVLPDERTPFGERVRRRLRDEQVIWLTTVGADGTPQPNPVWFVWQEPSTVVIYNRAEANRLTHIRHRPHVALHFDGNGGGDIVVFTGAARLLDDQPPAHEWTPYRAKYEQPMIRVSGSPERFSEGYQVAVSVEITKVRGN